jgi:hypothetical protein
MGNLHHIYEGDRREDYSKNASCSRPWFGLFTAQAQRSRALLYRRINFAFDKEEVLTLVSSKQQE